jgi:glucan phosphoethanolaminetransferase (alkaline phosphatase superfamily)
MEAASTLFHPIASTTLNIKETVQGVRTIYNTIGLVYLILMQFFLVLALNILCRQRRLFGRGSLARNCSFRSAVALIYTFIGAVCASALVFSFQDG